MTILAIVLAFLVTIAPLTSFMSTAANIATATDKVTGDVHTWRIDGCPQRQFNGTIKYLCAKHPPAAKKKPVVPQMAPQPPVYVPPPLPTGPAPDLKLPVPDKAWSFERLYAALIGLIALVVIGHGLRQVYRIWKGYA